MKPSSIKDKGRRLENFVNRCIEESGLGKAIRTPGSGSGKIKGDSFNTLPFLLEMKNEKQWDWQNIDQAREGAKKGNYYSDKWALVFRDPRYPEFQEVYVAIDLHQFLELMKKDSAPRIKEPDRSLKWKLNTLVKVAKEVIKEL
jgi:hypothetical protein